MTIAATEAIPLAGFSLPGVPYSVRMARSYMRTTLAYHGLAALAEHAESVTTELAANALTHAHAEQIILAVASLPEIAAIAIVVRDSSPRPPVKRNPSATTERGRGLLIIEALSARWGWRPEVQGKAVYAILTREKQ
jgi:anti-sigma regulatory factor (Ser/Thr protein kinase)